MFQDPEGLSNIDLLLAVQAWRRGCWELEGDSTQLTDPSQVHRELRVHRLAGSGIYIGDRNHLRSGLVCLLSSLPAESQNPEPGPPLCKAGLSSPCTIHSRWWDGGSGLRMRSLGPPSLTWKACASPPPPPSLYSPPRLTPQCSSNHTACLPPGSAGSSAGIPTRAEVSL